jgi:hypothetical protein
MKVILSILYFELFLFVFFLKKNQIKGIENENVLYIYIKQYIISFAEIYLVSYELQLHTKVSEMLFSSSY